MNSAGVTVSDSPTPANLFDEFEEAFQNCLAPLTKEDPLNGINQDELRVNAENNGQRFLELAHRMEAAFLQKRVLLSVQKPELLVMEENHEMRIEIARKDELIKKQTDKLAEWQNTLLNLINRVGSVPTHGTRNTSVMGPTPATLPPSHISMMGGGVVQPSGQSQMSVAPSPNSLNLVGGGMSHGPNAPHTMGSSLNMNTMPHQPIMGQVSSGGNSMGMMNQGGYQQMTGMSGSGSSMHGGSMGVAPQTSIGSLGGNQGPNTLSVGPGNMGSGMGVSSGPAGAGMFHGSVSSMGQSQGGLQGPLAYLEKTTTNIGMPEPRR